MGQSQLVALEPIQRAEGHLAGQVTGNSEDRSTDLTRHLRRQSQTRNLHSVPAAGP